jgi:hypothetical protein
MKVLFDVNMPRPLRNELQGHEVTIAQSMGWGALENGELILPGNKLRELRTIAPKICDALDVLKAGDVIEI